MINLDAQTIEQVAKMSPKEYYDFIQEISRIRGLPKWTTWEEYYEILDQIDSSNNDQ